MAISMKAARVDAGFTQKDAAKALNISKNTLARYETGKAIPKVDLAKRIATLYSFSVDEIIFFSK